MMAENMTAQEEKNEKEEKQEAETDKRWIDKIYMLHENEMWLNEQAKKGLILKRFDNTHATFDKLNPEDKMYKIVVLDEQKAEKQIKIIEHQGFTFVGNFKEYYIFYINKKYGNRKPRLSGEMLGFATKWFDKQIKKQLVGLWVLIGFIVALGLFLYFKGLFVIVIVGLPIKSYIATGIFFANAAIVGIRGSLGVLNAKKCFLEHEECLEPRSLINAKIINNIVLILFCVSFILPVWAEIWNYNNNNYTELKSISEVYESMPIVLIQDIENQNGVKGQLLETQKEIDLDESNYVEPESTLLSPKQYKAWQTYESNPGDKCSMRMKYYEVLGKNLARMLAKEIEISESEENKINKLDFKGLDEVYVYQDSRAKYVAVCKGKKVMFIGYNGEQPVERILEEMAEVL